MPPFNSILNALDPGNIPFYLKNLTYMEKKTSLQNSSVHDSGDFTRWTISRKGTSY